MKRFQTLLLGAALLSSPLALADGKALYTAKLCQTCHGAEGKAPIAPNYPKLAGQNQQYCIDQVKYIKSGARSSGLAAAMKAMVATLSDADSAAICKYLASVK